MLQLLADKLENFRTRNQHRAELFFDALVSWTIIYCLLCSLDPQSPPSFPWRLAGFCWTLACFVFFDWRKNRKANRSVI